MRVQTAPQAPTPISWAVSASDSNHLCNSLPDPLLWFSIWRFGLLCQVSVYRGWAFWQFRCQWERGWDPSPEHESLSCPPKKGKRSTSWSNNNKVETPDVSSNGDVSSFLLFLHPPLQTNRSWSGRQTASKVLPKVVHSSVPSCLHMGLEKLKPLRSSDPFPNPIWDSGWREALSILSIVTE